MKCKYIFIFVIIALILTSCFKVPTTGGPGTGEGFSFETIEEFKENFAEFMAFPSYIPYEFNKDSKIQLYDATYNKKGFEERSRLVKNIKKIYKRVDIFGSVNIQYLKLFNDKDYNDEDYYRLVEVDFSYFPHSTIEDFIALYELKPFEIENYIIYNGEYFESELFYPEKDYLNGWNHIHSFYCTEFDDKVYMYTLQYTVKEGISKEAILELRDKLKAEALPEVIKSYESLKYENKK